MPWSRRRSQGEDGRDNGLRSHGKSCSRKQHQCRAACAYCAVDRLHRTFVKGGQGLPFLAVRGGPVSGIVNSRKFRRPVGLYPRWLAGSSSGPTTLLTPPDNIVFCKVAKGS